MRSGERPRALQAQSGKLAVGPKSSRRGEGIRRVQPPPQTITSCHIDSRASGAR